MTASQRLADLSKDLHGLEKTAVKAAAKAVTKALEQQAARDTGGDRRLSGFKKKAVVLGVQEQPIGNGVRLSPDKRTYGQWLIVEAGAEPHFVSGKHGKITGKGAVAKRKARADALASGSKGAFSGAKPLRTPWGPRYRTTRKSSSPAKSTWTKGRDRGRTEAVDAVRDEFHKAVGG